MRPGGDHDVFNAGNGQGGVAAGNAPEKAGARNRQHHGAGSALFAPQRGQGEAAGVADDQLFVGHPGPKAQRAASQAAYRARRQLQKPGSLVVDAEFRVHRAVAQAQGEGGLLGVLGDGCLQVRIEARRRNVEGFLEIGAVQRVRLVEKRQRLQAPRR